MKICTKCKKEKELNEFYKDKRHIDGLSSYCKECHNKGTEDWRKRHIEENKEYHRNYIASYQAKNPNWLKAMNLVSKAIKKGKLKKLSCERCGNPKAIAHHPFYKYSEPLNVIWLCCKHHKEIHAEEKFILEKNKELKAEIEYKNQQLKRVADSIDFYLNYHHITEPAKTMIKGNLLAMVKNEFKLI